ncbi:MAG: DUF2974 domain-containing protein [Clostridia bacterium]|nr:DUF2974 domain-containing protein [Clostridia bacterium]
MPNINDYLDWRGDLPFAAAPFCEVDNLVLSMLSFLDFSGIVSPDALASPVKLSDAFARFHERFPEGEDFGGVVPIFVNDTVEKAAASVRFRDTYMAAFRDVHDEAEVVQFSAVTFILPDDSLFIAYRGTDDTLLGWREDFHLSFTRPVKSQELALEYLTETASYFSGPIRIGGHSKGGNLAAYAAIYAPKVLADRIVKVWSNDGPGFIREIIESPEFAAAEGKITTIVPQSSVIGMVLGHNDRYEVIESTVKNGLMQHDPYSWEVRGPRFLHLDELSPEGKRHNEVLAEWLDGISPEDRRKFTDTVFGLLESTGAKTVGDLSLGDPVAFAAKAAAMIRQYASLDKEAKDNVYLLMRRLAEANFKVR